MILLSCPDDTATPPSQHSCLSSTHVSSVSQGGLVVVAAAAVVLGGGDDNNDVSDGVGERSSL